nr:MAG TPA: hypothetical protein [Caudoviricetes sp.]
MRELGDLEVNAWNSTELLGDYKVKARLCP